MFTPKGKSDLSKILKKFNKHGEEEESIEDWESYVSSMNSSTNQADTPGKPKEGLSADPSSSSLEIQRIHKNNDSSKKGDQIVINHITPEPLMFRDCTVASVRNFKELAHNLHRALEPGEPPERAYRVLYFLLREQEAIEKLNDAFKKKDKGDRSLETALTERFGNGTPQLKFALQLIRKEDAGTDQTINRGPKSEEECIALSKRIHDALTHRDFETVYAVLTPFQRNTELLCRLNGWYNQYKIGLQADGTGLQADMKKYLVGDPLKFALFLIGDRAMETKVVSSLSEAERLAKVASQQTFERNDGVRVPVPHQEVDEGCFGRAHIITQAFKELGYASEKIYAHSLRFNKRKQKVADLHLRTDLARDSSTPSDPPAITYHTACCIWVRTRSGKIERRVVDPVLDPDNPDRQWTVEEWMEKLGKGPDSYKFVTFEEWQRKMEKECKKYSKSPETARDRFPADQAYVFTTSRNYTSLPHPNTIKEISKFKDIPDQYSNLRYNNHIRELMINNTKSVPFCRMVQEIRKETRDKTIKEDRDAERFLNTITENFRASQSEFRSSSVSTQFSVLFPSSYERFITDLKGRGVCPATVARFEEYLSGYEKQKQPSQKN